MPRAGPPLILADVYQIFVIPCQLAIVHSADVGFDIYYVLGYAADGIIVICQLLQIGWAGRLGGWSRTLLFNGSFLAKIVRCFIALPFDAIFWFYDVGLVPTVRLIHLAGAVEHSYKLLFLLQRSPAISYNKARLLHLLLLLAGVMHYVACVFVFVSRSDTFLGSARQHYLSSPWLPDGSADDWQRGSYDGTFVYLRAAYWAMMTRAQRLNSSTSESLLGLLPMHLANSQSPDPPLRSHHRRPRR